MRTHIKNMSTQRKLLWAGITIVLSVPVLMVQLALWGMVVFFTQLSINVASMQMFGVIPF